MAMQDIGPVPAAARLQGLAPDLTQPDNVAKYAADAANRAGTQIAAGSLQEDPLLHDPAAGGAPFSGFRAAGPGSKVGPDPAAAKLDSREPMRVEDVQAGFTAAATTALPKAPSQARGVPLGSAAAPAAPPSFPRPQGPPPQQQPPPVPAAAAGQDGWPHDDSGGGAPYSQYPSGMFPGGHPGPYPPMPPPMWPQQYMPPQMPGYPLPPPYMDPQAMAKAGMMFPTWPPPMGYMGMPPNMAAGQVQRGDKGAARAKSASKKARSKERRKRGRARGREKTPPPQDADDTANVSPALRKVIVEGAKCKLPLEEVKGHILEFAHHPHGSKFLQARLEDPSTTDEDKRAILEEALPEVASLSKHTSGNHFVQKLFEKVSMDQRKELATRLQGHILALTTDANGCRVIQKALHVVSRNSQLMLANELRNNVHDCIHHMHGNHVIQKCIEQMPPDSVSFIIQAVEEKVFDTASHMYGCRVIQRLLEHCQSQQLSKIQEDIVSHAQMLSGDPYGNYVVQHVLEHGRKDDKRAIIVQVTNSLLDFSKNKHSSNVVEKCFEFATCGEHSSQLLEERGNLMRAVLGSPGDPSAPICQMMNDKYGNYIVQRVIEYCKGPEKEILRAQLQSQEHNLRNNANGKHILTAAQKEFGENLFTPTGVP